ncbi:MAG: hypothetical protein LBE18_06500 [Planctomycetaceae bacterium]|nr:hypothetical protein [Planctomycetaceae bacterium]
MLLFLPSTLSLAKANFDSVISVKIHDVPLRDSLMQIAKSCNVSVFIDRRIDPSTKISIQAENKKVREVFQKLTDSSGLYCYFFVSVVYIGLDEMRNIFPHLLAEHRKFISQTDIRNAKNKTALSAAQSILKKPVTIKLPILSEPKKVLSDLAQRHQFEWNNLNKVPHDVWDENHLPTMPLGDLLFLILIGFDLDYICSLQDNHASNKVILRIIDIKKNNASVK